MDDKNSDDTESLSNVMNKKTNGTPRPSGGSQTLSLTSFLFGNIDAYGELEGDVFDPECKKHLASLSRLGLATLIRQVTDDSDEDDDDENDDDEEEDMESEDYVEKSPSAIDFSDIDELVDDYEEKSTFINQETEGSSTPRSDSELMPPPRRPAVGSENLSEAEQMNGDSLKPSTPLAAMLPSKYANTDVQELFPDFRPDSVLRFSRIFGPSKAAHQPRIWKHIKRKKRKKPFDPSEDQSARTDDGNEYGLGFADRTPVGFQLQFGPEPSPNQCEPDDEVKFLKPPEPEQCNSANGNNSYNSFGSRKGPKEADWRFGPAQLWYDMLEVPAIGQDFDYGFKVKEQDELEESSVVPFHETTPDPNCDADDESDPMFSDDAFHMVTQMNWEEEIIWNGEDSKHKLNQKRKNMAAGWVPSSFNRTAQAFSQPGKTPLNQPVSKASKIKAVLNSVNQNQSEAEDNTWYSIFPVENEELVYEKWENHIIWDPDNMAAIPEPNILTLDPNDENIILGIPEDVDPATIAQGNEAPVKVKIPHPHVKKSKILLGKAGVITTADDESPPPPPKSPDKDPFNLSNDEHYQPKSTEQAIKMSMGGGLLQHSTPVVELQSPFVATFMGEKKLRLFHRAPLKHYSHGALAARGSHAVHSLTKEIKKKAKVREQERLASGGGDVFFMRSPEDLTGRDGDIIMMEYCEEFPPLVSMVGMCTRMKNYYKRKAGHDKGPPDFKFGDTSFAHTSPFLGSMHPGQSVQTLENNMARFPIYEHKMPQSDFLVIRTRNGYSIRELDGLFCAGQQCPLYEVPGPNSKRANNFIRDFLQVFIYRLFWKSHDEPKRIKMDEIKRAFPAHSESSIRKRLKPCAEFKRTGVDSNWWVIKPNFRLPTEDEIRAMVSPEQTCAFFGMLSAEQRLKDAGYGDKFLSALEDDNDDDTQKLDDEIKVAPWHTTRAYIHAVRGKCLLQLTGPADPTGCGEGFSYIRIPNKPTQNKEEQEQQPKRTVTGTDADLRKLSLNNAKNLLRNYGVPEEEIKKLSRWEVIDVVRTLSTEKAKAGEEGMNKFSRGNRFSIAEHQERYKEECQRIFDLQNRVLASEEVLSTDDGSSSEEENDSDMEEKGKYIENILANKKTSTQMSMEKEEQERKELQKMIMGEDDRDIEKKKAALKKEEDDGSQYGYGTPGRMLRIVRHFKDQNGERYVRTETVRKTAVIDTYVRLRSTKDETFIRGFVGQLDDNQKEEIKKERRRLQEQLRRIKRNQERLEKGIITPPKTKKPKLKPDLKLKCGACGQVGHMRTNKACPMYTSNMGDASRSLHMSVNDSEAENDKTGILEDAEELINVEGTKIKLSGKVMKHAEELKRRSLMKGPRDRMGGSRRRRAGTIVHCDYLNKKNKSVNRRRIDPVVTLSTIFEEIVNEMRDMPDTQPFLFPVNVKQVPDYYTYINRPMDLQTIRENTRQHKYQSREDFLCDINQMLENSKLYNGGNSTLTQTANKMMEICIQHFARKEERLMKLEKAINPLLDDDDQVSFDFVLENIIDTKVLTLQDSYPFWKPVNKKNVKDYYDIIQEPMDLDTVTKKIKYHKYHSREDFMRDLRLIQSNSEKYNGADSAFSQKARAMVKVCSDSLNEYAENFEQLEMKIASARQRAMEQIETDSNDSGGDDDGNYSYVEPDLDQAGPSNQTYGDDEESAVLDHPDSDVKLGKKVSRKRPRSRKRAEEPSKRHKSSIMQDLEFSDLEDDAMGQQGRGGSMPMSQFDSPPQFQPNNMDPYGYQGGNDGSRGFGDDLSVDPNFDPSEAFMSKFSKTQPNINNDLAVSESDDELANDAPSSAKQLW